MFSIDIFIIFLFFVWLIFFIFVNYKSFVTRYRRFTDAKVHKIIYSTNFE
nr:MAG TPA: hypothetical protein [Caudoviricetes sp.]